MAASHHARGARQHLIDVFLDFLRIEAVLEVIVLTVARADCTELVTGLIEEGSAQLAQHLDNPRLLQMRGLFAAHHSHGCAVGHRDAGAAVRRHRFQVLRTHDRAHAAATGCVFLAGHHARHAHPVFTGRANRQRNSAAAVALLQFLLRFRRIESPQSVGRK